MNMPPALHSRHSPPSTICQCESLLPSTMTHALYLHDGTQPSWSTIINLATTKPLAYYDNMLVAFCMMLHSMLPQLHLSLEVTCVMQIQEIAPLVVTKFRERQAQLLVKAQQVIEQQNRPKKRERRASEKVFLNQKWAEEQVGHKRRKVQKPAETAAENASRCQNAD